MKKSHCSIIWFFVVIVIALPYVGFFFAKNHFDKECELIKNAELIIINKQNLTLKMYDYKGNLEMECPIACGKNYGDKKERGDMRTPEGVFHVSDVESAWDWSHDFNDGKGVIDSAYGPWFIRLDTPGHSGMGIHGTHAPESIGTRATEGCIRLKNEDLIKLKDKVHVGMLVIITPSEDDVKLDAAIIHKIK